MKKLLYYIHDRTLAATNTCMVNVEKISEKIDGTISLKDRINVFFHLKTCHCCSRYHKHLEQLQRLIQSKSNLLNQTDEFDVKLSKDSSDRIKERLRKEINNL